MRGGDTPARETGQARRQPPASTPPGRLRRVAFARRARPGTGDQALRRSASSRWPRTERARRFGIGMARDGAPLGPPAPLNERAATHGYTRHRPARLAGTGRRPPAPAGPVGVLMPVGICCAELIAAAVAAWPLYFAAEGQPARAGEAAVVPLAAAVYAAVRCGLAGWPVRRVLAAATVTFAVVGWLWMMWLLTAGPSFGANGRPAAPGPLPQQVHPLMDSQDHPLSLAGLCVTAGAHAAQGTRGAGGDLTGGSGRPGGSR